MKRIIAYIDGYNLYHSLKEAGFVRFYWLDLPKLMQTFSRDGQSLVYTYYFTSPAMSPLSKHRQDIYISALETEALKNFVGFKIIRGHFIEDPVICTGCNKIVVCDNCGQGQSFYHEKETDVNIAVQMLLDTYSENFDIAYLLTADSDQVGTIRAIRELNRNTEVDLIIPPKRNPKELVKEVNFSWHITSKILGKCQLPDEITASNGYKLVRPGEWRQYIDDEPPSGL